MNNEYSINKLLTYINKTDWNPYETIFLMIQTSGLIIASSTDLTGMLNNDLIGTNPINMWCRAVRSRFRAPGYYYPPNLTSENSHI